MARGSIVAAVVVAVLVAAAPARAADPGVAEGLALGQRAFGGVTCGTVVVARADFVDDGVMAGGDPTTCRILLNRRWVKQMTRAMRCTLVMHEYGHLAGEKHSDDPDSVMYAAYQRADPRCLRALAASRAARGRGTSGSARTGS